MCVGPFVVRALRANNKRLLATIIIINGGPTTFCSAIYHTLIDMYSVLRSRTTYVHMHLQSTPRSGLVTSSVPYPWENRYR